MKSFAKLVLIGTIAVMAIAMSSVASEAAKKKKAEADATCGDGGLCSTNCANGSCAVNFCAADKKWYPAILTPFCIQGQCPPPCP